MCQGNAIFLRENTEALKYNFSSSLIFFLSLLKSSVDLSYAIYLFDNLLLFVCIFIYLYLCYNTHSYSSCSRTIQLSEMKINSVN